MDSRGLEGASPRVHVRHLINHLTFLGDYKDLAPKQIARLSHPSVLTTTKDAAAIGDITGGLAGNIYLATHGAFKKSTRDKNRR